MHIISLEQGSVDAGSSFKYNREMSRLCDLETHFSVDEWGASRMARRSKADGFMLRGDRQRLWRAMRKNPYILIEHDVWTMRKGSECANERKMIERASAVIFTSEDHVEYCAQHYDLPPYEVIHLRPSESDLDFTPMPKLPGRNIVYAGGITANAEGLYGYRAYHDIFRALMALGWTVHVYPAWASDSLANRASFEDIGCIVHKQIPQNRVYEVLSQYQLGFHGYAETGPQDYVKSCRPNKTWEYLAAGIPTLGYNGGNSARVYDGRWGIEAESLDSLAESIDSALALRITDEMRREQVIERDREKFARVLSVLESA